MANTHDLLIKIVTQVKCKPKWRFSVVNNKDDSGKHLIIQIHDVNNYNHSEPFIVNHCHPVPEATYNEKTWKRWIFEQCMRTMTHELGESLRFGPEELRPFAPMHGPGEDPYTIHEWRPELDALTTQDGSLREGPV